MRRNPLLHHEGEELVETEREMLREKEESGLGERRPFESSRQATYEDSVGPDRDLEYDQRN